MDNLPLFTHPRWRLPSAANGGMLAGGPLLEGSGGGLTQPYVRVATSQMPPRASVTAGPERVSFRTHLRCSQRPPALPLLTLLPAPGPPAGMSGPNVF